MYEFGGRYWDDVSRELRDWSYAKQKLRDERVAHHKQLTNDRGYNIICEVLLRRFAGDPRPINVSGYGDKGDDAIGKFKFGIVPCGLIIDVKSTKHPEYLLVEQGTMKESQLFVLACWYPDDMLVEWIGWAWRKEVEAVEPKRWHTGKLNHWIDGAKLPHKMDELIARRDAALRYAGEALAVSPDSTRVPLPPCADMAPPRRPDEQRHWGDPLDVAGAGINQTTKQRLSQ